METKAEIAAAVAEMKAEITADIAGGRIPASVTTYSDLHDYVDANEYGGFCDDARRGTWTIAAVHSAQWTVNRWLQSGRQP